MYMDTRNLLSKWLDIHMKKKKNLNSHNSHSFQMGYRSKYKRIENNKDKIRKVEYLVAMGRVKIS